MAKSAKKKKQAAPAPADKTLREITGILFIVLGLISVIALISTKAPLLSALEKVYRLLIGIGVYSLPVIFVLSGIYVIGRRRPVGLIVINLVLATGWVAALYHMIKFRASSEVCFSSMAVQQGGGYISGYPACAIDKFVGPAAGTLLLIAIALVYVKLATGISYLAQYEKLALKLSPVTSKLKQLFSASAQGAAVRLGEARKNMAENMREKAEAHRVEMERIREENSRRLMEEIKSLTPGNGNGKNGSAAQQPPAADNVVPFGESSGGGGEDEEQKSRSRRSRLRIVPTETVEKSEVEVLAPPVEVKTEIKEEVKEKEKPKQIPLPEVVIPPIPEPVAESQEISPENGEEEQEEVLVTNGEDDKAIAWCLPEPDEWLGPMDGLPEARFDHQLRDRLEATLKSFQVPATITNVVQGASFTRFEVTLEPGVKVSRIITLENDIALSLAADSKTIRIEAPIPGKSAIGIEVPNRERAMVPMRKIFLSEDFQTNAKGVLTFVLGEDITGTPVWTNLVKMPHLLVAGSTNSGKSVCVNTIISSIIARQYPEDVRMILVDMKRVELTPYEGIPHLLTPVIKEAEVAAIALKWVCEEMDRRYKVFAEVGVRNIDGYNQLQENPDQKFYRIMVIIDELADLMMVALPNMNVEHYICRITQLARATGIHMILATQRPDTKVITGTIKNNIPTRISFAVPTQIDSRTILDQKGAETLLGRGDMLYMPVDSNRLARLQGCFVSDDEIRALVEFWKHQQLVVEYPLKFIAPSANVPMSNSDFVSEDEALYRKAVEIVVASRQASISKIQRMLRIGYNRAARLVELMEERGVVGPYDGSNPREVLLTQSSFESSEF